jgi:drug/metabolite transporter (DMT)-like permease
VTAAPAPRLGVLCMVGATLLWGATFVVTRDALASVPPVTLVLARFVVAGVLMVAVAVLQRRRFGRDAWIAGALSGPFVAACYALQASGLTATSAGSSAFLTAAGTLTLAWFAWIGLGQRPGRLVVAGIALALLGSALLSWRGSMQFGRGELVTLVGAAAYAVALVIVAARITRVDPVVVTALQTLVAALVLIPFASAPPGPGVFLGANRWRFLYLAIAGSVIAPLLQVTAQRALPSARIGILFALEPVFALLFAVTVGAERFEMRWWLGAGLILSAVLLVEGRSSSTSSSSPDSSARSATT